MPPSRAVPPPTLAPLEPIPVLDTGPDFPLATLAAERSRADALLDLATRYAPAVALRQLDRISRRWLEKWNNAHLAEIDAVARTLDRPGAYFFSVNYEWGCTCRVAPSPDSRSARLIRVLDWRTPGLGRNIVAARVAGAAGRYVTLTWPGYTGVLTGMAAGRFAAALNQAPMRRAVGFYVLDWAANRRRVWSMPHPTPAHLLRDVFDTAKTYVEARRMLETQPISTPAIFSLAGLKPSEIVVIERTETEARIHDGCNVAANHWQAPGWSGRPRGVASGERAAMLHCVAPDLDQPITDWLAPPVLNSHTRLAMVADAAKGCLIAQGFEAMAPATLPLELRSEEE